MKVELRLVVEYGTRSYDDESDAMSDVQEVLHRSIARLVGNGGLSEDLIASVVDFEVHTSIMEE